MGGRGTKHIRRTQLVAQLKYQDFSYPPTLVDMAAAQQSFKEVYDQGFIEVILNFDVFLYTRFV